MRLRVEEHRWERETINFGETVAGAPCFSEEVNGNVRKGVFEKSKLDAAVVDKSKCDIVYEKKYFINITDGKNFWEFGNKSVKESIKFIDLKGLKCCRYMRTPATFYSFYVDKSCSRSLLDVEITNPDNIKEYCPEAFVGSILSYPIVIKYSEGQIIPGEIRVYIERG